jgi:hypothetical protein
MFGKIMKNLSSPEEEVLSGLPRSLVENLFRLKEIETVLGNIPPEEINLKEIAGKIDQLSIKNEVGKFAQLESQTELVFGDICDELSALGKSPIEIAKIINSVVKYEGGPKYCNEKEVADILGIVQ